MNSKKLDGLFVYFFKSDLEPVKHLGHNAQLEIELKKAAPVSLKFVKRFFNSINYIFTSEFIRIRYLNINLSY